MLFCIFGVSWVILKSAQYAHMLEEVDGKAWGWSDIAGIPFVYHVVSLKRL